jgi:pantoate--beta-alanine ligase
MLVSRTIIQVRRQIHNAKAKKKIIGFVPTMGALHHGHLSLVRAAKKECDFMVVSIFVNPTQFGPKEDSRKYPRVFNKDKKLLQKEKVDLIFSPSTAEIYAKDFSTYVEETYLSKVLCGASRPGHFRGVCTVVAKLFNVITPDIAYFGAKDYQQAKVIKRMVADLNFPVKIKVCPIVREADGLAMSSRNRYLNKEQRKHAGKLHSALLLAKRMIKNGERDAKKILSAMVNLIKSVPEAKIDYIKIVCADTLRDIKIIKGKVLIALAVFIGTTRLIDNKELYVRK